MMKNYFKGRHFQQDIIWVAVGYYFRFNLSYRDVVEILRDRGITVHHTTIMRWVHHYGPIFQVLWRRHKHSVSQSWRVDETYIKVKGQWCYLYRAIDMFSSKIKTVANLSFASYHQLSDKLCLPYFLTLSHE